jgi:hypothetical protein
MIHDGEKRWADRIPDIELFLDQILHRPVVIPSSVYLSSAVMSLRDGRATVYTRTYIGV